MDPVVTLVDKIYDSVVYPSRSPLFLEAFVRAIAARGGVLAIRDLSRDEFVTVCWHGWTDEEMRRYMEHYALIDHSRNGQCAVAGRHGGNRYRPLLASGVRVQCSVSRIPGSPKHPSGAARVAVIADCPVLPHKNCPADSLKSVISRFLQRGALCECGPRGRLPACGMGSQAENGCLKIISPRRDAALRQALHEVSARDAPLRRLLVSRAAHNRPYRLIFKSVG